MIDYMLLYKEELPVVGDWPDEARWDIFLSGYTSAERVRYVYDKAVAGSKYWLVFPQYGFAEHERPAGAFAGDTRDEAEYIRAFWDRHIGSAVGTKICVDTTGFIRPYLMFLLRWFVDHGVKRFDALYTEPVIYSKREQTRFSDEVVVAVRQISGFEGTHNPDTSNDYLIIGAGYDHQLRWTPKSRPFVGSNKLWITESEI